VFIPCSYGGPRTSLLIEEGRHPSIEQKLCAKGKSFVANSLEMLESISPLHIITGPNMQVSFGGAITVEND
jgi:DNA mismatch repair ATPase MutS